MLRKTILALILCVVLSSCKKDRNYDKIEKAKWLVGRWENDSKAGKLVEEWMTFNDSTLIGFGLFIVGQDTVFSEDMQLVQRGDSLSFSAKAYGQNDDKPVKFDMTSSAENEMTFENPKHDFPNKIIYKHVKDSLYAEVSGVEKGQPKVEKFSMKKK